MSDTLRTVSRIVVAAVSGFTGGLVVSLLYDYARRLSLQRRRSAAYAAWLQATSLWALRESPCRCVLENRTLYLCPRCFVLKKEGRAYGPEPYEASREVNPISPHDFLKEPAP